MRVNSLIGANSADRLCWSESLRVGWLDEARSLTTSTACYDGFRRDGCISDIHDVLLADSETVRSGNRRWSCLDRRRSDRHGCLCWRCCVGSRRCRGGRHRCSGGGGSGTAAGTGSAGSRTTAVESVGSVGAGSSASGRAVSPPSSSSEFAAGGGVGRRQPDPPTLVSALSSIGGEPLTGSGFETQPPQRGFAPASIGASDGSTAAKPGEPPVSAVGVVPDVAPAGNAGVASPQPITARRASAGARAADYMRGFRRRLGSLPSDAAPHATPPRIPIEHQD